MRWQRSHGWRSPAWSNDGPTRATSDRPSCSQAAWLSIGLALLGASVASHWLDLPRLFRAGPWLVALRAAARSLGARVGKAQSAAAALLRHTPVAARGLHRGLATSWREHVPFAHAARDRVRVRCVARVRQRCGDRLVARHRLLGAPGAALSRTVARDRLAAAGVLCVSVELERQRISDRPGDRVSRHRVDLVRRGECQRRLLRRGTNAWRPPGLSDPQGRHPGGDAVGVRRAVHGPWRDRSRCWSWRR